MLGLGNATSDWLGGAIAGNLCLAYGTALGYIRRSVIYTYNLIYTKVFKIQGLEVGTSDIDQPERLDQTLDW